MSGRPSAARRRFRRQVRRRAMALANEVDRIERAAGTDLSWVELKVERAVGYVLGDAWWLCEVLGPGIAHRLVATLHGAPWPDAMSPLLTADIDGRPAALRAALVGDLGALGAAIAALPPDVARRAAPAAVAVPELRAGLLTAMGVADGPLAEVARGIVPGAAMPLEDLLANARAVLR